jgi:hypothetical protein
MTQRTILAAHGRSTFMLLIRSILMLSLLFFACSSDHKDDDGCEEIVGNSLLLNFTNGSRETGELRWMNPDSERLSTGTLSFNQDARVSAGGGNIFVLESNPGNLSCILPKKICNASTIKQESLDAQYPYEATVIGSQGYIALNDEDYVQVFNTSTCTPSEKINLPISGANASSIKASGNTLLVVLQRLENWSATKPGLLVRIDATTKELIDTIQLKFYNPHSTVLGNGKLYVSSQGSYNPLDNYSIDITKAGVEVVDLAKGTTEVLVTGTQLGGGANGIALDEASQTLYVSVQVAYTNQPVKPVNLANKSSVGAALPSIADSFSGLVFDNVAKKLFVGDNSGLKVYSPETKITTAIDEGTNTLPPYSLAIVRW